jgi:uncharacterized protein YbjT (DUF2867 family)
VSKKAIILGATGLVGSHVLNQLIELTTYEKIFVLLRRKIEFNDPKIEVILIDFNKNFTLPQADHLYICIGTTLKKAGSKEAQYTVDCSIPSKVAQISQNQGLHSCAVVSSVGADAQSRNFYLKTKGELEENLKKIGFNQLFIGRPSFILGNRAEFRLGEKIGIFLSWFINPFLIGNLKKYKGVQAHKIASTMIEALQSNDSFSTIQHF